MGWEDSPRKGRRAAGVRWSMLVSHHPPCDYDRTLRVGGLRICTRCFGVLLGAVAGLALRVGHCPIAATIRAPVAILLPVPAVLDFIAHEFGLGAGSNATRLLSGLLVGLAVAVAAHGLLWGSTFLGLSQTAWLASLEFAVAALMRCSGRLEGYVRRYEEGVRRD